LQLGPLPTERGDTPPTIETRDCAIALEKLVDLARRHTCHLRQSYRRVTKRAAIMVGRYTRAHQHLEERSWENSVSLQTAAVRSRSRPDGRCRQKSAGCMRLKTPHPVVVVEHALRFEVGDHRGGLIRDLFEYAGCLPALFPLRRPKWVRDNADPPRSEPGRRP